jgi:signal peptidase I
VAHPGGSVLMEASAYLDAAEAAASPAVHPRWRGVLRVLVAAVLWFAIGLAIGLTLAMTVPQAFGYKILTVMSGSMEPTLDTRGVVLVRATSPLDARIGDIVTFRDPSRRNKLITHRLRAFKVRSGRAYMVTRGDASGTSERWAVATNGAIGRVAYHVPAVGYPREWLTGRWVRVGTVVLLALLGLYLLFDIWGPSRAAAVGSRQEVDERGAGT